MGPWAFNGMDQYIQKFTQHITSHTQALVDQINEKQKLKRQSKEDMLFVTSGCPSLVYCITFRSRSFVFPLTKERKQLIKL